jgi:2-C-methyl-D-erythritol 4-phosphate cytidylyltransferase
MRLGGRLPKQFLALGGTPILVRTLRVFAGMREVAAIVVVVPRRHMRRTERIIARARIGKVVAVVAGGAERQASVRAGLVAFPAPPEIVLVHDAVRPFVRREVARRVLQKAGECGGAVAAVRVTDTIKEVHPRGDVVRTLAREQLWAVQTPQGFRFPLLLRAHREADRAGFLGTDEASLVERLGLPVRIVEGDASNMKITTRLDLETAKMRVFRVS